MNPILIPKDFDMARLLEKNGSGLIDYDDLYLFVQNGVGEIPENHGLGIMSEAKSCTVYHEINGQYDLEMQYPITGHVFSGIEINCVILASHDRSERPQPFRIYRITKPIDGIITIYAHHLAYDLSGIIVKPFKANDTPTVMQKLMSESMSNNLFRFSTTKNEAIPFSVKVPTPIWSLMGSGDGNIIGTYNGEYKLDGYNVQLVDKLGMDRSSTMFVRYGVNLLDFEHDADTTDVFSGIVAYWESDNKVVYTPVISEKGGAEYTKVKVIDMTSYFDEAPSTSELISLAKEYVAYNKISELIPSWRINFIPLDMTEEYRDISALEIVNLGDIITISFPALNIDATARVNAIEWDSILDRYVSISLGNIKNSLADTIAGISEYNKKTSIALSNMVVKVPGKGLSSNDYTNSDKKKLNEIADRATNVQGSPINGYVNINGSDVPVYHLPNNVIQDEIVQISRGGTGNNIVWENINVEYDTTTAESHSITAKYSPYLQIGFLRGSVSIVNKALSKNTAYNIAKLLDHLPTATSPIYISLTSGGHGNIRASDGMLRFYSHSDLPSGSYYIYFSAWWYA